MTINNNTIKMTPRLIALLLITMASALATARAQTPEALAALFDGPYRDNKNATETIITGPPLSPYSLTTFHSLQVRGDPELAQPIEAAVKSDGLKAVWMETVHRGRRLESGVYELPATWHRRYILYLNRFITGGNEATVIYLEGSADPDKIKKMIKTISD